MESVDRGAGGVMPEWCRAEGEDGRGGGPVHRSLDEPDLWRPARADPRGAVDMGVRVIMGDRTMVVYVTVEGDAAEAQGGGQVPQAKQQNEGPGQPVHPEEESIAKEGTPEEGRTHGQQGHGEHMRHAESQAHPPCASAIAAE